MNVDDATINAQGLPAVPAELRYALKQLEFSSQNAIPREAGHALDTLWMARKSNGPFLSATSRNVSVFELFQVVLSGEGWTEREIDDAYYAFLLWGEKDGKTPEAITRLAGGTNLFSCANCQKGMFRAQHRKVTSDQRFVYQCRECAEKPKKRGAPSWRMGPEAPAKGEILERDFGTPQKTRVAAPPREPAPSRAAPPTRTAPARTSPSTSSESPRESPPKKRRGAVNTGRKSQKPEKEQAPAKKPPGRVRPETQGQKPIGKELEETGELAALVSDAKGLLSGLEAARKALEETEAAMESRLNTAVNTAVEHALKRFETVINGKALEATAAIAKAAGDATAEIAEAQEGVVSETDNVIVRVVEGCLAALEEVKTSVREDIHQKSTEIRSSVTRAVNETDALVAQLTQVRAEAERFVTDRVQTVSDRLEAQAMMAEELIERMWIDPERLERLETTLNEVPRRLQELEEGLRNIPDVNQITNELREIAASLSQELTQAAATSANGIAPQEREDVVPAPSTAEGEGPAKLDRAVRAPVQLNPDGSVKWGKKGVFS